MEEKGRPSARNAHAGRPLRAFPAGMPPAGRPRQGPRRVASRASYVMRAERANPDS